MNLRDEYFHPNTDNQNHPARETYNNHPKSDNLQLGYKIIKWIIWYGH